MSKRGLLAMHEMAITLLKHNANSHIIDEYALVALNFGYGNKDLANQCLYACAK